MRNSIVLAVLLARHDMNHDNWATVQWSRAMCAMAHDLQVPHAMTDHAGRPIVDALPADDSVCPMIATIDVYADADERPTIPAPPPMGRALTFDGSNFRKAV